MLAKFKAFGLRSLNKIRLMNLNKDNVGSLCKRNLPRLASTSRNGYKRMDENHNESDKGRHSSTDEVLVELGNGTNYLLTGLIGSAILLERKYDIVKNVTQALDSAFVVHAKSTEKEGDEFTTLGDLLRQSNSKPEKRKNEPDLRKSYNFIANACESALPSVVKIVVKEDDPHFGDQIVVASGSGFVVSNDKKSSSLVLTNCHVIENHKHVQVETLSCKKLVGTVEYVDKRLDLAAIRIEDCSMTPLEFESTEDVRVGEFVVAIGYLFTMNHSVTMGIISSKSFSDKNLNFPHRSFEGSNGVEYIQTDCSTQIGSSGGPLIALNGRVIGVNTIKVGESGMNLALPSDYAMKFVAAAKKLSTSDRMPNKAKDTATSKANAFGATTLVITPAVLQQLKEKGMKLDKVKTGLLLVRVAPASFAEKCGLKQGDVLVELNGCKITNTDELLRSFDQNGCSSMLIVRADQKIKINVKS